MRIGELCNLKVSDIKKKANGSYYLEYWQRKTKTFNTCDLRPVDMSDVRRALEDAVSNNNGSIYIFPSLTLKNRPFSRNNFVDYIKKLIIDNDIRINGKLIVFKTHKCRRTKVSRDIKVGKPDKDVSISIGHKYVSSLGPYVAKPDITEMKDALEKILDIDNKIIGDIIEDNDGSK